jgi:hypothetical protein
MAKLEKHANVLADLRKMAAGYTKEASVQKSVSGTPGHDTHITSVSDKHDTTDKNAVGADKLKQEFKQHHSSDPHAPIKSASEIAELGNAILGEIKKVAEGVGQGSVAGTPGADTKITQVDDKNDTTNKNEVGADKNEQKVTQDKSTDASAPVKTAGDIDKVAQEELGRQLAAALIADFAQKQEKVAMEKKASLEKEAGRRDFEVIANAAVDNLFKEKVAAEVSVVESKYAEELGKVACDIYVKDQIIAAQKQELDKYAAWFENLQQEVLKKEAQEAELQKQAQLQAFLENTIQTKLASLLAQPVTAK